MKASKLALWLGAFLSTAAVAGPADYIYTPTVEYGEREIDFKFGSARLPGGNKSQAANIGFGYGATEWWFTEVYLKYAKSTAQNTRLTAVEWENKFQLTESGKYPVDVGLVTELEVPRDRNDAYEFKFGPLFQTEFGKVQLNGNLLFEREFSDGLPHKTEMGYQWQVKYRWQPKFEVGLQGFGEVGEWNNWDSSDLQKHQFGPAVFGKIAIGERKALKYNAAWLVGTSKAAPDHTFRLQVEYEF